MKPKIAIIILNWNGWMDTIECLESIYGINYENYDVIVVDNNSSDKSVEMIKKYCQGLIDIHSNFDLEKIKKPIKIFEYENREVIEGNTIKLLNTYEKKLIIIKNDKNYGFAEGNNIGIKFALMNSETEYVVLLNNDTIVDKDYLNGLIKESSKKIGIIGSKIYLYDHPNILENIGGNINFYLGEVGGNAFKVHDHGQFDTVLNFDAVCGCSMFIKKDVFEEIGLLNSDYFLYYEDTDFCYRAKNAGFQVIYSPHSKIWHKKSVSTNRLSGTKEFYSIRNLFIFMKKYSNKPQFICFLVYFFGFRLWFNSFLILIYHREPSAFIPFIKGIFNGLTTK